MKMIIIIIINNMYPQLNKFDIPPPPPTTPPY